jgi:hypothetical protein
MVHTAFQSLVFRVKRARLRRKFEALVERRAILLQSRFDDYMHQQSPTSWKLLPRLRDISMQPGMLSALASFDPRLDDWTIVNDIWCRFIEPAIKPWSAARRVSIESVVPEISQETHFIPVFLCTFCTQWPIRPIYLVGFEEAMAHRHPSSPIFNWRVWLNPEPAALHLQFHSQATRSVSRLLELLDVVSIAELDDIDGRFICTACSDYKKDKRGKYAVMSWRQCVRYVYILLANS